MTKSRLEAQFELAWRIYGNGVQPEREYQFAKDIGRKFRFDFAFPAQRLAIECDGGQYAYRGGRHATDADREKLNIAACLHWRVLRFSGSMLRDPKHVCEVVKWGLGE
jgi:very-short-patch-repair endonuclease